LFSAGISIPKIPAPIGNGSIPCHRYICKYNYLLTVLPATVPIVRYILKPNHYLVELYTY